MKEKIKNISKITVTTQEVCYYLFFSLIFFAKGIGLYDGQTVFKFFLLLSMVFLGIKLLLTEYTMQELIIMALLCIAALLSYYNTREKGILFVLMIVIGLKNVPLKRIFGVALFVWSISFIPTVWLTTLGWIASPFRVHVRPLVGFIIRWGLGSAHPNVGHIAYLIFTVLAVYVLGEKISWKWCLLLFSGNCFVFLFTVSQTGFLMTSFYLAAVIYLIYRKKPSKLEYALVECVLPACILASLVLPVILKGKAFDLLNKLMNTRMMQSKRYLTEEKITLFGSRLSLTNAINTMDNSYLFAFMTYGVITFGIIAAAYFLLIHKCVKEQKKRELAMIVTLLITGLSEPFLFNTSFKNISLLFLGGLLFQGKAPQGGVWGRTICFLKNGNRTMQIPVGKGKENWRKLRACAIEKGALLAAGAVIGAVLWAGIFSLTADIPDKIIVPRQLCDSVEQESIYMTAEDETRDALVLGYQDEETPMVVFDGTLSHFEYVRGLVCRAAYGAGVGFIVVLAGCSMIKYKDSSK